MSSHEQHARQLLAEALGIQATNLPKDASIETVEAWDSLAHMRIVIAMEEKLGTQIEAAEIVEIASVQDIASILDRHDNTT